MWSRAVVSPLAAPHPPPPNTHTSLPPPRMKLTWLKEVALNLDKDHQDVEKFVVEVLSDLTQKMKDFAKTEEGRAHSTELRLLMRVL